MSSENPNWSDIVSTTLTRGDYFAKFENKPIIQENFENYTPKIDVINQIKEILSSKDESVKFLAIGASWCKDCTSNIPRLIKIVDSLPCSRLTPMFY